MKNKFLITVLCVMSTLPIIAQQQKYSAYHYQRASLFEVLPTSPDDIIFLGNSITDGGEWTELFNNKAVKNRGISADVTQAVYDRLTPIVNGKPAKVFLLIGINDLAKGIPNDTIVYRISKIIDRIKTESPTTKLYLQSILPVNECYGMYKDHTSRWMEVAKINEGLQAAAKKANVTYVDIYTPFIGDEPGRMNPEYSNDGLHLMGAGYLKWVEIITPYVNE